MKRNLLVGAHPDDIDVMLGYAAGSGAAAALIGSDGEAGVDMTGSCLCRT